MSSTNDVPAPAATPPSGSLHERTDDWLALVLGRDLQTATLRATLYLAVVAAVLATIGALVG